jgi:FAD:protein FMN transferase
MNHIADSSMQRFPALGGIAAVAVTEPAALNEALACVQRGIAEIDAACSPFRDDSELSTVNAAAGRTLQVSPLFVDAIGAALRAAELTAGDVDPTVGEALVALGFSGGDPARGARPLVSVVAVPGYEAVELDRAHSTVRVARGVRLDLGATAKAFAADRAATQAAAETGCGVLVSLSGDVALAGQPPAGGWRIRVTDDHRAGPGAPGQWVALRSGGLATSSTTVRRGASESVHHVIDPATGLPAQVHFRTASVAAGSCLDANIASTATIVRGARALDWLREQRLPSRLVLASGTVVHVAGWPAGDEDLIASVVA